MPLFLFRSNNIGLQIPANDALDYILDTPNQGQGYVNDYHNSLVDGYRESLQTLAEWAHSRLNLQLSAQVSYNLPMDMAANIPFVDTPECKSLAFMDSIDAYRQYTGPASLAGKWTISNEMGAILSQVYCTSLSTLLSSVSRATAGGVNQYILHGQAYTGDYYGTTWPGYTAFNYLFSEQYSEKQPYWDRGFADVLEYITRLRFIHQQGVHD